MAETETTNEQAPGVMDGLTVPSRAELVRWQNTKMHCKTKDVIKSSVLCFI